MLSEAISQGTLLRNRGKVAGMRRALCVILAMLPGLAHAEVTTPFCRPKNGAAWVGQIDIDLAGRTMVLG